MRLIGLVPQEINFNMFEKPFDICVNYAGFYGVPRAVARERAERYAEGSAAVGQGRQDEPHAVRRHETATDDRPRDDDRTRGC